MGLRADRVGGGAGGGWTLVGARRVVRMHVLVMVRARECIYVFMYEILYVGMHARIVCMVMLVYAYLCILYVW